MYTIEHELQELIRVLDPSVVDKANRATLKAVRGRVATEASRATRKKYNVTARHVSQALKLGLSEKEATIDYVGKRTNLLEFQAKFKRVKTSGGRWGNTREGATVKIRKDKPRKLVKGGFIANSSRGNPFIWKRKGADRFPIKALKGPSVAQMVDNGDTNSAVDDVVANEYPKIFANKAQFYLDRIFR